MNLARLAVTAADAGQASEHHAFCRKVRSEFPVGGQAAGLPPKFRDVIAIVASSRGGSSLLFDMLRSTGAFACLDGEHSTLYKLHGLGLPADPAAHDGTVPADADLDGFLAALAEDVSAGPAVLTPDAPAADVRLFASRTLRMLAQQWPGCPLSPGDAWQVVHATIARHGPSCGYHPPQILMPVLRELRASGWPIDPWYFDISPETIAARFPGAPSPHGPHSGLAQILEAPPFLVPSPAAALGDRGTMPLLLKASMDAYRIPLLRELFPDARLRLIHLTRNPAAAINGLIDGWLHHGFFSHNLGDRAALDIDGYSGQGGWARSWWNFDLPPGWREVTAAPLATVCAAQWTAAHTHIMASRTLDEVEVLRLRAERVLDPATRSRAVAKVIRFCQAQPVRAPHARLVVATRIPEPGRWRARWQTLAPVLADEKVRECAAALGYGTEPAADWA